MSTTFALFSALAIVGGDWIVHVNQWGRTVSLLLLTLFALSLFFSGLAEKLTRPFTRIGNSINPSGAELGFKKSFFLGIATGLLWAPCAGPILGLVLTGAAIKGASINTLGLLFSYALGAATALSMALFMGSKLSGFFRRYLNTEHFLRQLLGIGVLIGVAIIAFGWDRGVLTRVSKIQTQSIETKLIGSLDPESKAREVSESSKNTKGAYKSEGLLPSLSGATTWLNSAELTPAMLKGKVVLIDFWTYSCINCLRSLPYVKAWSEKYKNDGLLVVGIHSPEFAFEKDLGNVQKAVKELGINYPVALDNNFIVWSAFKNQYWPAHYLADATGNIRYHHFGEGQYEETEGVIRELLVEDGLAKKSALLKKSNLVALQVQMPSDREQVKSPETYIGYDKAKNLIEMISVTEDVEKKYAQVKMLSLNQWTLSGWWNIHEEFAETTEAHAKISYRFHARDLHLVLGANDNKQIKFTVKLDGLPPGKDHGVDTDERGRGVIKGQRLYQLIRQKGDTSIRDRSFEIEFDEPGAEAFAFTFG
jgi:cytochrome c biogenesis protein CcdA/thiol-disulfide isomerase/thioredoxin